MQAILSPAGFSSPSGFQRSLRGTGEYDSLGRLTHQTPYVSIIKTYAIKTTGTVTIVLSTWSECGVFTMRQPFSLSEVRVTE